MLRVTVELVPLGYGDSQVIASAIIANDGTSHQRNRGHYVYQMWGKRRGQPWREGRIENFPRQSKNVWYLLKRILEDGLK